MPPKAGDKGSPQDWMRLARADLALASVPLPPHALYELLCFHAQQAVEKSLKAILVKKGIDFPPTHNLQILIDLLPKAIKKDKVLTTVAGMTIYAVTSRYPSEIESVTQDEYQEALQAANEVVAWVQAIPDLLT